VREGGGPTTAGGGGGRKTGELCGYPSAEKKSLRARGKKRRVARKIDYVNQWKKSKRTSLGGKEEKKEFTYT